MDIDQFLKALDAMTHEFIGSPGISESEAIAMAKDKLAEAFREIVRDVVENTYVVTRLP